MTENEKKKLKETLIAFGKRVSERRTELDMTQDALAKATGYTSRSSINKIEVGLVDVPQSKVKAIAQALSISPAYLVGWSKEPYPNTNASNKRTSSPIIKSVEKIINPATASTNQASNIYDISILYYEEIGTVCAGFGGTINEIPTGKIIEIPTSMIKGGNKEDYFVLRVKGNSMYPRFLDGDTILCQRCSSVDSGDIAVVLYNGDEATVKKVNYVTGQDWLELIPINPEYPTKRIEGADLEQCHILGLVIKLIRDV